MLLLIILFLIFIDRPEYSETFLAHFSKTRTYIRLKAQIIRMKEDHVEKLRLSRAKRDASKLKRGKTVNKKTALSCEIRNNMTVRDYSQRAYHTL